MKFDLILNDTIYFYIKKIFEVFLTQEQSKFINQQLPKGFSLQFTSITTRRPCPSSNGYRPLSEEILAQEKSKPKTRPKQGFSRQDIYDEDSEEASSRRRKQKKMNDKIEAKTTKQLLNSNSSDSSILMKQEDIAKLLSIVSQLKQNENIDPIFVSIDSVSNQELNKFIKNPIDLTKVEQKLKQNQYKGISQFVEDVKQIWKNGLLLSKPESQLSKKADKMSELFKQLINKWEFFHSSTNSSLNKKEAKEASQNTSAKPQPNQDISKLKSNSKDDIPLTQEEKVWVYQSVEKLSDQDKATFCTMIQSYCVTVNFCLELNLDSFPVKKAREVFEFLSSKLKPAPQTSLPPRTGSKGEEHVSEIVSKKKKKQGKGDKMDIPLTPDEKKQLGMSIRELPPQYLIGIWSIVQDSQQQSEVIEFDIDILPVRKARELEAYVKEKTALNAKNIEEKQQVPQAKPTSAQPPSYGYQQGITQQSMFPQGVSYSQQAQQQCLQNGGVGGNQQYLAGQNGTPAISSAQQQAMNQIAGYGHLSSQQQFSQQQANNFQNPMMMQQYASGFPMQQQMSSLMGNYGGRASGFPTEQVAQQAKTQAAQQFQAQQYGASSSYSQFPGSIPGLYSGQLSNGKQMPANGSHGMTSGQMPYSSGPVNSVGYGAQQPTNYYQAAQYAQFQAQRKLNEKFAGGNGFGNQQPTIAGKKQANEQSSEDISGDQSDG